MRVTPVRPYCRVARTRRDPSEYSVTPGVAVRISAFFSFVALWLALSVSVAEALTVGSTRHSMAWAAGIHASAAKAMPAPARTARRCRAVRTCMASLLAVAAIVAVVVVRTRGRRGLVQQHPDHLARLDVTEGLAHRLLRGTLGLHHHDDLPHVGR